MTPDLRGLPRALLRGELRRCFVPVEVETERCVHLSGSRYCADPAPAAVRYLRALLQGQPEAKARRILIDQLRRYRPQGLADALGLPALERDPQGWIYPWERPRPEHDSFKRMWHARAAELPGVLYHFSPEGIPASKLDAEFVNCEQVLAALRDQGYSPLRFAPPVRVQALVEAGKAVRYLVLDGHHRVLALAALGVRRFMAICRPSDDVILHQAPRWYGVRHGAFSLVDARRIFAAFAHGELRCAEAALPAELLADERWLESYGLAAAEVG